LLGLSLARPSPLNAPSHHSLLVISGRAQGDNRAIFTAASHAQRAADFINGLQPASAG